MNFTLAKTTRVPGSCRPVRCWSLQYLLNRFGLPRLRSKDGHPVMMMGHRTNPYDLWDEVRAHWVKVRRSLHPDVRGDAHRFARLCEIYFEIRRRLQKKGVLT